MESTTENKPPAHAGKGEMAVQETTVRGGNATQQGKPRLEQDQIGNASAARMRPRRKAWTSFRVDRLDE